VSAPAAKRRLSRPVREAVVEPRRGASSDIDNLAGDRALMQAWELGHEGGWTDAVMDEAERLMPTLLRHGYAAVDEEACTWWFTEQGIARAEELETVLPPATA
jgi:hypothetical protein